MYNASVEKIRTLCFFYCVVIFHQQAQLKANLTVLLNIDYVNDTAFFYKCQQNIADIILFYKKKL